MVHGILGIRPAPTKSGRVDRGRRRDRPKKRARPEGRAPVVSSAPVLADPSGRPQRLRVRDPAFARREDGQRPSLGHRLARPSSPIPPNVRTKRPRPEGRASGIVSRDRPSPIPPRTVRTKRPRPEGRASVVASSAASPIPRRRARRRLRDARPDRAGRARHRRLSGTRGGRGGAPRDRAVSTGRGAPREPLTGSGAGGQGAWRARG
jgi:hypothetical protein